MAVDTKAPEADVVGYGPEGLGPSTGFTASVLDLALERIGHRAHAVYDGSWAEWGMYDDLKVAKE